MTEIDKAEQNIQNALAIEYHSVLADNECLKSQVDTAISDWRLETAHHVYAQFPFADYEDALKKWQKLDFKGLGVNEHGKLLSDYSGFCGSANVFIDIEFWRHEFGLNPKTESHNKSLQPPEPDLQVARTLLFEEWEKTLDQTFIDWELKEIKKLQEKFLQNIFDNLEVISQLSEALSELGLELGRWLDLSHGALTKQQVDQFRRWAQYFRDDEGAKQICEILGKMRQIELSERLEKVMTTRAVDTYVPDQNSKEEIVGIHLGRDMERVLPIELASLSDSETSILFDLKFVESRLMCFEMQGLELVTKDVQEEAERTINETQTLGPMVLCIDTSGSMHGTPESIGKAVALFMATKAHEQNRPCHLINFSTRISTLDLTGSQGLDKLIDFLSMPFHGGTDVAPALSHAMSKMKDDAYQKADLLIISDFIMAELPQQIHQDIEQQREFGNRFYSLVIGDCFMANRLKTEFDNEWIYEPQSGKIQELVKFSSEIVEA